MGKNSNHRSFYSRMHAREQAELEASKKGIRGLFNKLDNLFLSNKEPYSNNTLDLVSYINASIITLIIATIIYQVFNETIFLLVVLYPLVNDFRRKFFDKYSDNDTIGTIGCFFAGSILNIAIYSGINFWLFA